jgi:hypothetical protein
LTLRILFIAEALVSLVTGLGLVFAPVLTLDLYGLETDAVGEFMAQNYGGLYLGLGLLAWLVRNVTDPPSVRALTTAFALYHVVLLVLALLAWLGDDFDFGLGWASVLLEAAFGLAFAYFRVRARDASSR